ncbi:MAG: S9 family peptidase [Candidatus Ancillula sp.]|jgi:oligopeptidase B|nr:S9 family peptidase [Candidatus Ancillula sp.]
MVKKVATERIFHGDVFIDEYEWMRAKDDVDVLEFLNSQNSETEKRTAHTNELQEQIFAEIKARTKETDMSVAARVGDFWYFSQTVEGLNYALTCRFPVVNEDDWMPRKSDTLREDEFEVIFDPNVEVKKLSAEFYSLGSSDITEDGAFMLYAFDVEGNERYELHIRDLNTSEDLNDVILDTAAGATFDVSGRYVFYTRLDDTWRSFQVWRHEIGTEVEADVLVFQEDDERFNVGADISRDKRWLYLESTSKTSDEIWILDANNPSGVFECILPREKDVEAEIVLLTDQNLAFLVHNRDSDDFDIDLYELEIRAESANSQDSNSAKLGKKLGRFASSVEWGKINGVSYYQDFLLVSARKDTLNRVYLLKMQDFLDDKVKAMRRASEIRPEGLEIYSVGASATDFKSPIVCWSYVSYTSPSKLLALDVRNAEQKLIDEHEVLALADGTVFNQAEYCEKRVWVEAEDGEKIPMSIVYKKHENVQGAKCDDDLGVIARPTIIYGYGSYGISLDPYFSVPRLSLLDRGVVFAVAHVRGGSEKGRKWYLDGKLLKKRNSFTDFVACSKWLIESGVAAPDRLIANGGSAGGLLVGAALNLAPELYAGVEADVPFVDPLTSILKPELPLTIPEWEEWGNPVEDRDVYEYMKSYSPYENIAPLDTRTTGVEKCVNEKRGVRILATTSLNDTRVLYVEPAKWVAKLQENGYDALLKCEMEAGHGGVSGRYNSWKQTAFEFAWCLDVLRVNGGE